MASSGIKLKLHKPHKVHTQKKSHTHPQDTRMYKSAPGSINSNGPKVDISQVSTNS